MNTLPKPIKVREILLEKNVRMFTLRDFGDIFHVTPTRTKYFLETQTREGLFARLKKGMYVLGTDVPSEEEIANSLYRPSYVSFEYALAYWGILPEMPYAITSATTKPTRDFIANGKAFSYFTIKREAYTGYQLLNTNRPNSPRAGKMYLSEMNNGADAGVFLIAEPEKALVDYLYFVSLGKKILNDRLYIKPGMLNKSKVRAYARLYNRKRLKELVEEYLNDNR